MTTSTKHKVALGVSSDPRRGIVLILISGAVFTVNDTAMKWLRADYPVGELVTIRGIFSLIVLACLVYFIGGWHTLRVRDWRAQWLRSLLVLITTVCFLAAIRYMPLADAMGIAFAGPLFTVALAGPLLGERIGWYRWAAVGAGFVGVLLMVRPTGAGFQLAAFLPLVTALCGALRDIVTRRMSVTDHSNATLAFAVAAVVGVGLFTWPVGEVLPSQAWIWPTPTHLALFVLSGVLMGIGQYCVIESLRVAQAAVVAPFKYTSYLWALALGYIVWRDVPSVTSLLGALIVISSGLFIFLRERNMSQTPTVVRGDPS